MDTFDGIFAGKKKMIKAMKDSRSGSFGVQAVIIITLLQISFLLKISEHTIYFLPMCLFWGRFSTLFYINNFKYINSKSKSISHKKYWRGLKKESLISLSFLLLTTIYYLSKINSFNDFIIYLLPIALGVIFSIQIPNYLGIKTGGFNGDTCGASVVITETIMLSIYAIFL